MATMDKSTRPNCVYRAGNKLFGRLENQLVRKRNREVLNREIRVKRSRRIIAPGFRVGIEFDYICYPERCEIIPTLHAFWLATAINTRCNFAEIWNPVDGWPRRATGHEYQSAGDER